ncbi:MAG: HAD-IIB family hydrolase [Kiritimatiellia bacterium]
MRSLEHTALASDFDGTLFFWNKKPEIAPANIDSIRAFRAAGGRFGICTGRCKRDLFKEIPAHLELDFAIVSSGAMILDSSGRVLRERTLPVELVEEVVSLVESKAHIGIQAGGDLWSTRPDTPADWHRVSSLRDIPPNTIHAISASFPSTDEAEQYASILHEKFGGRITAFQNVSILDIVSSDCSKGIAVQFVKGFFPVSRMAGIGDSFNDIPLLRAADVSFTFPTSPPPVQNAASMLVNAFFEAVGFLRKPSR